MMGRITFANVTSDLFAVGVTHIDTVQIIIKISTAMTDKERDVIVPLLLKGFQDGAKEVGCRLSVGTVIENPWCTIGGTATALCLPSEFLIPIEATPGDVLILTKALGTQIACSAHCWIDIPEKWEKLKNIVTRDELEILLKQAMHSMGRLNFGAAALMQKYKAHACTDVTGFGLLGHCQNLVQFQRKDLKFVLKKLPIFKNVRKISEAFNMKRLLNGTSPETSGGLLIAIADKDALAFCRELEEKEKEKVWIVGHVEQGNRCAEIVNEPEIIEVDFVDS